MSKSRVPAEGQEQENRLLKVLMKHVGRSRAISMAALHEAVSGTPTADAIKEGRQLRKMVTRLRREGHAICSHSGAEGGGYYIPSAGSELADWRRREQARALKILGRLAALERVTLPAYVGQMALNLKAAPEVEA